MSDLELKEILTKYPDCLNNGTKLKAILLDEYQNVQKAIINTLSVIVNLGITAEMQQSKTVTVLEYNRWKQVILDEGYSENITDTCLTLFINSIKSSGSVPPNTVKQNIAQMFAVMLAKEQRTFLNQIVTVAESMT